MCRIHTYQEQDGAETIINPKAEEKNMKEYIGTKIIKAEPMNSFDASAELDRNIDVSNADFREDGSYSGYLVEYPDGYRSWSPKKQFEDAYFKIDNEDPSPIMKYFKYSHLPEHLQEVSRFIGLLAMRMDTVLPGSAEKSAGLRKLLEAKDCFVRAALK